MTATTVGAGLAGAVERLRRAGVPSPGREARLLMAHAAGLAAEAVFGWPERTLDDAAQARFEGLVRRRADREPLAYLLGAREFWNLPIRVTAATLVPRPETETLVEAVLEEAAAMPSGWPRRILDLGTGSGCLLLALLAEFPGARGVGVDRSAETLGVARLNAESLGMAGRVDLVCGNWGDALAGGFDVVVANPPYVAEDEIAALEPEVSCHEPRLALAGGADGLAAYRAIIPDLNRLLAREGCVALEVGAGQAPAVAALLAAAGLERVDFKKDLSGIARCVRCRRVESPDWAKKALGIQVLPD